MTELLSNESAPITTLSRELRVAENVAHQRDPQIRRAPPIDSGSGKRRRKAEARKGRNNHIERVGGIAAERCRVGQRTNHLVQIPEGPRPSVRENQRDRLRTLAWLVDEMNGNAVDGGAVMREAIDFGLVLAPVIVVAPVSDYLFEVGSIGAVRPVFVGEIDWVTDTLEALLEIGQDGIRYRYFERFFGHGWFPFDL